MGLCPQLARDTICEVHARVHVPFAARADEVSLAEPRISRALGPKGSGYMEEFQRHWSGMERG